MEGDDPEDSLLGVTRQAIKQSEFVADLDTTRCTVGQDYRVREIVIVGAKNVGLASLGGLQGIQVGDVAKGRPILRV